MMQLHLPMMQLHQLMMRQEPEEVLCQCHLEAEVLHQCHLWAAVLHHSKRFTPSGSDSSRDRNPCAPNAPNATAVRPSNPDRTMKILDIGPMMGQLPRCNQLTC